MNSYTGSLTSHSHKANKMAVFDLQQSNMISVLHNRLLVDDKAFSLSRLN